MNETTPQHEADARRLKDLLHKIRDGLVRSLDSLKQAIAGSQLPDIQVGDGDVKSTALYLRDRGLKYDGQRLLFEFTRLQNRCIDEWLASIADGKSQEYRDHLTELFGSFPSQGNPTDSVVVDRRVSIVGLVVQMLDLVDDIIESACGGDGDAQSRKRKYVKKAQAERIAREKYPQLWRSDNRSEWARIIGYDRKRVDKLKAWRDAERRRNGVKKFVARLYGLVDPSKIAELEKCDLSSLFNLSDIERQRIRESGPDAERELRELITEQAIDDAG